MIVYVESNFVLEIALGQEDTLSAKEILALSENGKIDLVFPGFALSEPFATITHRDRERKRLSNSLSETIRQLQRSEPHRQTVSDLQLVPGILTNLAKKVIDLLQDTVKRLLRAGKSIELTSHIFEQAIAYQFLFDLSPQDSIIYAVVIADLNQRTHKEPKCFISRDKRAFSDPGLGDELASYNCTYAANMSDGLDMIKHTII